jgi:hypothetical protein
MFFWVCCSCYVFLGNLCCKITSTMLFCLERCRPQIDLSNELLCTLNGDRMQKLRPQEVDVLTYPNGAHMAFGASSPRVRFLDI